MSRVAPRPRFMLRGLAFYGPWPPAVAPDASAREKTPRAVCSASCDSRMKWLGAVMCPGRSAHECASHLRVNAPRQESSVPASTLMTSSSVQRELVPVGHLTGTPSAREGWRSPCSRGEVAGSRLTRGSKMKEVQLCWTEGSSALVAKRDAWPARSHPTAIRANRPS
jgi:hypothetical protein